MIIFEKDAEFVAQKVAMVSLRKFMEGHPELDGLEHTDEVSAIYRRAYIPKAYAKLIKKCTTRGHTFERGEGPRRPSVQRHIDRFMKGLVYTIERASERLEKAIETGKLSINGRS